MVHRRQIDDTELVFGVHGALFGNAMTWWDHETGSVWSQPTGEAILGPRRGERVELMTSEFTTWGAWRAEHPDTLALDAPGRPSGFDLADFLIVVDFAGEARGYRVTDLREVGVVNDTVAGVDIAVLIDPSDPNRWKVFSRSVGDTVVRLAVEGDAIVDLTTGTAFEPIRGLATDGPLDGEILNQLPGFTSFPGDFGTFWPDGTIWEP